MDSLLISSRSLGWTSESAFRSTRLGMTLGLRREELVFERIEPDEKRVDAGGRAESAEAIAPLDYVI